MKIKGYEIHLNKDNEINKFSKERILSKHEITIENRFYKNFLYIDSIQKKAGISPEKYLYWCNTDKEKNQHGFHFKPKNFFYRMRFLWYFKKFWIQEKDNIMWLINILVAILAIIASLK